MEATPPTLQQFMDACRREFEFVVRDHGFTEVAQPPAEYQNPFAVHFERDGWRLLVEGLSYGFGAGLMIRDPEGRMAGLWHVVPKDFFNTHRDGLGRGQLGDVSYCALTLRTFGADFLAGDTSIFTELLRSHDAYIERDRREIESWPYQRAAKDAAEAFSRREYPTVVKLLSPYIDRLSEMERRKLDYARNH